MKHGSIIIKLIKLISLILLYYIYNGKSLFLYMITLSLYNIYSSCFKHISIKDSLTKINTDPSKFKILKYTSFSIIIVVTIFIFLSILMSDTINILLNVENTFFPYLIMSISVISEPLIKISLEYLESYNKPKLSNRLLNTFYITEVILSLIISILTVLILKLPIHISISTIYLAKILSYILIGIIIYLILKKENITISKKENDDIISYKNEIQNIITKDSLKSIIKIVKHSYYYISIIILYMILSTKYSYDITYIEHKLTFIYLFALNIIQFIIYAIHTMIKLYNAKIISYILSIFKCMITIAIIIAITSPLICKIIFNNSENSIYLMMMSFLSIFIILYDITFENIKNKKIIYISLIIGIVSKIILIVPLINSFYRLGYNLIYGDVISTIISLFISIAINYIYLKNKNKKEKTLEKILTTLYESIILCIILILLQFIIPITTNNYIISLITLIIYISVSIIFLKYKKKERG